MGQLQPTENEDETGSYENERGKVVRQEWSAKRRKNTFFCHKCKGVNLPVRWKVGMEVT